MPSSCKYLAPNGKPSKLYNDLINKYNSRTALRTWLQASTFPITGKDSNGEYTIKSIEDANLILHFPGNREVNPVNLVNRLTNTFTAVDIPVQIVVDPNLPTHGSFSYIDETPTITFNPNKIANETIYHEFGYLYVDLLGLNNPLIQKGIEQLRGTPLWVQVESLYPELTEDQLAKEVLTTAIGIEADKLYVLDSNRWSFWLNRLFRAIGDLLGLNKDVAKLLAKQLVNGNVQKNLEVKYNNEVYYQKQLNLVNNKFLTQFEFLEKARIAIHKKIQTFYKDLTKEEKEGDKNYQALKELEDALLVESNQNVDQAIIAFISQSYLQTGKLVKRVDQIINPTEKDKLEGKDKLTAVDLRTIMKYNSTFAMLEDVIDLMQKDADLKAAIDNANLTTHLNTAYNNYIKVKRESGRLAINLLSQKFTKLKGSKTEGIRRLELEKEYNTLNAAARKAAKKKDRKTFSAKEKTKFKENRRKWVEDKLKAEASALAQKELERWKYLLQQANQDISYLDRAFTDGDALNDEIINVVIELLDKADFDTMTTVNSEYDKVNKLVEAYNKKHTSGNQATKYDTLLENDYVRDEVTGKLVETEKKGQYLVSKYKSSFIRERRHVWNKYQKAADEYGDTSNEAEVALEEAKAWDRANTVKMPDGEYIPVGEWINPAWTKLQEDKDSVEYQLYSYLIDRIEKDDKTLPEWAKLQQYYNGQVWYKLPSIKKHGLERIYENGLLNEVKDTVKNVISARKENSTDYGGDTKSEVVNDEIQKTIAVLTDEEGNEKHDVPINFRYNLPLEDQSFDLPSIFLLNHAMVTNYDNKSLIQADLELTRELVADRKVAKTNSTLLRGALVKVDKLFDLSLVNDTPVTTSGVDSNAYKALASIIEDRLYGIASKSSITADKIASVISMVTGNVLLVGNYLSSGANLAAGSAFNWLGTAGGNWYTSNDITVAHAKYTGDMINITQDIGKIRYSSKTNLLMEKFNSLGDWRAIAKKFADDTRFKQLFKGQSLHVLNNLAEHAIQNVAMYAILNNTKVLDADGNFLTKDGTTTDITKAMSLDEAYSVVDGKLVLDSRVVSTTKTGKAPISDIDFIMSRVIRDVNAYLQGQYSDQKRSEIQRFWYGKLIMLLRKWLPRGLKYRWRGIGSAFTELDTDDIFYSRALQEVNEGYYTTSLRFIHGLWTDLKALKQGLIMHEEENSFRAQFGLRWKGLSDQEQGNIHKTIREAVTIVVLINLASFLKELGDENDESAKAYYLTAFYALRLQKELLTYVNPAELSKTLRSPSAALIMVDRVLHFLSQLTSAPGEVYATGRRKGQLKIAKDLEDLFPIFKHIDRDVEEALTWLMSRRVQ